MRTTQITTISSIDALFPKYGEEIAMPKNRPTWNESQKLFIIDQYESAAGNRYYKGLRFSNRIAIVEVFGTYHTWTYINSIELYMFQGTEIKLVEKKEYPKEFYDQQKIKNDLEEMASNYIKGTMKMQGYAPNPEATDLQAKELITETYNSFLSDNFDEQNMLQIIEHITPKDQQPKTLKIGNGYIPISDFEEIEL